MSTDGRSRANRRKRDVVEHIAPINTVQPTFDAWPALDGRTWCVSIESRVTMTSGAPQIGTWTWTGKDQVARLVRGTIDATSSADVRKQLARQGVKMKTARLDRLLPHAHAPDVFDFGDRLSPVGRAVDKAGLLDAVIALSEIGIDRAGATAVATFTNTYGALRSEYARRGSTASSRGRLLEPVTVYRALGRRVRAYRDAILALVEDRVPPELPMTILTFDAGMTGASAGGVLAEMLGFSAPKRTRARPRKQRLLALAVGPRADLRRDVAERTESVELARATLRVALTRWVQRTLCPALFRDVAREEEGYDLEAVGLEGLVFDQLALRFVASRRVFASRRPQKTAKKAHRRAGQNASAKRARGRVQRIGERAEKGEGHASIARDEGVSSAVVNQAVQDWAIVKKHRQTRASPDALAVSVGRPLAEVVAALDRQGALRWWRGRRAFRAQKVRARSNPRSNANDLT